MAETRDFHISDVLSVTTGMYASTTPGLSAIHEMLEWMAGEPVWTHQLPRVMREAAPAILRLHPEFAGVDASTLTPETAETWRAAQVARFGARVSVPRMTTDEHERIDPLSELAEKVHPSRIHVIAVPPGPAR